MSENGGSRQSDDRFLGEGQSCVDDTGLCYCTLCACVMVIYELCAVLWMRGKACGVWDEVCGIAGAWAPQTGDHMTECTPMKYLHQYKLGCMATHANTCCAAAESSAF